MIDSPFAALKVSRKIRKITKPKTVFSNKSQAEVSERKSQIGPISDLAEGMCIADLWGKEESVGQWNDQTELR